MRKTTIALYVVVGIALTHSFATKSGFLHQSNFPLNSLAVTTKGNDDIIGIETKKNIIDIITELEGRTGLGTRSTTVSTASSTHSKEEADNDEYTAPLLRDIELLSGLLGEVIKSENECVFELYEKYKAHALARADGDVNALGRMINCSEKISPANALGVVRAFTQTLNLINAAEVHHRMRILRNTDMQNQRMSPLPMREDSVAGTIDKILNPSGTNEQKQDQNEKKNQIFDMLLKQKVDIVLTAHPTEVNRRTLLRKYRSISEILDELDREDVTPYERSQTLYALKREIASIWGSDEIRRQKPTPQQEARGGLAILESVLWDAVPSFLRKLNSQCVLSLDKALPLDHVPIHFSSWMGGDRDGNPNVTPKVTFEVATTQRLQVAKLLLNDVVVLYKELAICKGFSPDMLGLAAAVKVSYDRRELYRRVLGHVKDRLLSTIYWCEEELKRMKVDIPTSLQHVASNVEEYIRRGVRSDSTDKVPTEDSSTSAINEKYQSLMGSPTSPMFDSAELLHILKIMHSSLCNSGYSYVADGLLTDIIRRVAVFGLTLVPLDIRQESTRHTSALDAITRFLGVGSYAQWDEQTKINWLQSELSGKRPLFRTREIETLGFDSLVLDTLKTFETAASLGPGSIGAYVISQSRAASDVLAVMLLQKQFGMTAAKGNLMRVVPLFETLNDLNNAPEIISTLFSVPNYVGSVKGKQEIMVGYSDSAKDAGRLAASWALYESQEKMVEVAEKYKVDLTFFHGKGGTVGRGGNPALYRAVLAHPPRTVNGKFRVTEQGEMITQNFGSTGIAERTLDIYTAAVLAEQFVKHVDPKPEWRQRMKLLSEVSCDEYRTLIEKQEFISYFRKATPELELGSLNIGSRPSKRNPKGGIDSLRAIPWTFAWTQTRLHLPAWVGVGDALWAESPTPSKNDSLLTDMYNQWPFFREMIDLIAMTLSKTDYSISCNYELQLVDEKEEDLSALGEMIRQKLIRTRLSVLHVTGCDDLSSGYKLLQRSMKVRYPYVDPLNVLQAAIMKRLRTLNNNSENLNNAAVTTSSAASIGSIHIPACVASNNSSLSSTPLSSSEEKQLLEDSLVVSINGIAQGMKNSG